MDLRENLVHMQPTLQAEFVWKAHENMHAFSFKLQFERLSERLEAFSLRAFKKPVVFLSLALKFFFSQDEIQEANSE